ncbi:MAG: hypothetical protein AB7O97_18045 [Planctomycetota bacterium]
MLTVLVLLLVPQEPVPESVPARPMEPPPMELSELLAADPRLAKVLASRDEHRLQVLWTEVLPGTPPALRRHALGDPRRYFYPASSVKLGAAIAARLELRRLEREAGVRCGDDLAWRIGARFDGDAPDAPWLRVDDDLRAMLTVSANPPFNHCFELLGPNRLNAALWDAGLSSCRIWHRLSERHPLAENRVTRPVTLRWDGGELALPARDDDVRDADGGAFDNGAFADLEVGLGYLEDGVRVDGPMSFAEKNAIALRHLQDLLLALVRPRLCEAAGVRGFPALRDDDRAQLVQWITVAPAGPADPDNPIAAGTARVVPKEHLRVRSKSGRAYGFAIENTEVLDLRTGRAWFLSAALYANPDGILNDDAYAYEETADPFLRDLAETIARAAVAAGEAR